MSILIFLPMLMKIIRWCWLTFGPWIMFVVFTNKTFPWFKHVCIKKWTYEISARFLSLAKMSRNRNNQDWKVPWPKQLRPKQPDRFSRTEMALTETAQTETASPNRPDRKVLFRGKCSWIPPDLEAKTQHYKTASAAFYLNIKEARRELKVKYNNEILPWPKYLGVTLDRSLTYRRHLESLRRKLTSRVAFLTRFADSSWGAGAQTLRIATSALVHSTAEYCAPIWCRSAHTLLLTPSSTMPCELWSDDCCVLHQRTTFLPHRHPTCWALSQWRHTLWHSVLTNLNICSTQHSHVHLVRMHCASNRDTHLYPLHNY